MRSSTTRVPAPMPRLKHNPARIPGWIRQGESELHRMLLQPAILPGPGKVGCQFHMAGRTDVEGAAGVMFTATGHGVDPEDVGEALATGEFAMNDSGLPGNAAKSGDRQQFEPVLRGRHLHPPPSGRGAGCQPDDATSRTPAGAHQSLRLALEAQPGPAGIFHRNAKPAPDNLKMLNHLSRPASARLRWLPDSPCPQP